MEQMIYISGGDVLLKDARRKSERTVSLEPFEISDTPVSVEQFKLGYLEKNLADITPIPARSIRWLDAIQWCNQSSRQAGLEPAYRIEDTEVVWNPLANGYRLPTEAEWVYASQAGTFGPRHGNLTDIAWTEIDEVDEPQPMGLKNPNAYGLFDTLGNVWEWCWDRLDSARYGNYRLMKGGGWADPEWSVRVGVRRGDAPDAILEDVGFRVARGVVLNSDSYQGWSEFVDRERASTRQALPVGWTPLRF